MRPEATESALDQPARLMQEMRVLDNVYSTINRYRSLTGHNIHKLTDSDRVTLRWLMDEGHFNG